MLTEKQTEEIIASPTPEEAYKKFMSLMAPGIANLLADALSEALQKAKATGKTEIDGVDWTGWINTGMVAFEFGTPPLLIRSAVTAMAQAVSIEKNTKGIGVSIGVSISF